MTDNMLSVENLAVDFARGKGRRRHTVRAVDELSFSIEPGEAVALVGESGCGKTTTARSVVGLVRPTSGSIRLRQQELVGLDAKGWRGLRREVQMVFQDPYESLNPRKTVLQTLAQPLVTNDIVPRSEVRAEAVRLLDSVGLTPGEYMLGKYPHEFSGGQRQRIGIARAIAVRPSLILADEPVSALDTSVQAQVLRLFADLRDRYGLSMLFITHNLGVVRSLCDRVVVMYLGRHVEAGPTEAVFAQPRHPYTRALLDASPIPDPDAAVRDRGLDLGGDIPSAGEIPSGCRFHPRCPVAVDVCAQLVPDLRPFARDHLSACHIADRAEDWNRAARANAEPPSAWEKEKRT